MGLIDDIKSEAKKSGSNKGKFIYFRSGNKLRIRFLQDMEDGFKLRFHDSFVKSVNIPCQELFDRTCKHCDDEDLRHRDQYAWSVWDYDAKEVKILMAPVNNASPIPSLVAMFDNYGTIMDRDYVITKNGQGTTTNYSVVPMDKAKFRNDGAKPLSRTKLLQLLDKAFPDSDGDVSDDDYKDEEEKTTVKKDKGSKKEEAKEPKKVNYKSLSPRELYDLCVEREIDAKVKKPAAYYIEKLEDDDAKHEDGWDDDGTEDEDDDWGEDDE